MIPVINNPSAPRVRQHMLVRSGTQSGSRMMLHLEAASMESKPPNGRSEMVRNARNRAVSP